MKKLNLQLFAKQDIEMPVIETRLEVKNEIDSEVAKMYLSGTIRKAYPWEDEGVCISANNVKRELDKIGDKNLNVYLNSGGGDVFESIEIRNLLKMHQGKVKIIITGRAGSGASVIATAGEVDMFTNTMQMIHKASTIIAGNADDLRKMAGDLDKIDEAVKASYMKKFIGTEQELKDLIAEETWLTAEECKVFGLCDNLLDEIKDEKKNEITNEIPIKVSLFDKYKVDTEEPKKNLLNKFKTGGIK